MNIFMSLFYTVKSVVGLVFGHWVVVGNPLNSPLLENYATDKIEDTKMNLEIESKDIIRLMLQFMKENNLHESMKALSTESGIKLNTVTSLDRFTSDINHGKWDSVLLTINDLSLPKEKLAALYEQIVFELLEGNERDLAKEMLRTTMPLAYYKAEEPQRYLKLERLCQQPYFNSSDAYENISKERRRFELSESLASEVSVVPPSRLLAIINQAFKYQQSTGSISIGSSYDLFYGGRRAAMKDVDDKICKKLAGQLKFTVESHPEAALFSPDGHSLVTGSVDGFIEVWDYETCKLRKDLEYQLKDELMMHKEAVISVCFSKDGEHLVTGSQIGILKIWKISSGECLKRLQVHSQGITSISFSKDNTQLLTSSYDHLARITGLKSGKIIKEFRGHTSFVNCALYIKEGSNVVTVSSDGTYKIWDIRTSEILSSITPGASRQKESILDIPLQTVLSVPNSPDHVIVCTKGSKAYLMTIQGQVIQTYSSERSTGDFMAATLSPHGKWLYCAAEDGYVFVFNIIEGKIEESIKIDERELIGIFHHPHRNIIGTMNDEGLLKLWKA